MNAAGTAVPSTELVGFKGARVGALGRWLSGGAAVVLLLLATTFPLWQAKLNAPQYPGGLDMIAYGDRVTGDVSEINLLNHYIGMKPLKWNEIPERALWTPGLIAALIAAAVASISRNKLVRRILCTMLWLFPIGVILDIQFRLYQYGHDLDEEAALRVPKFTIWVFGPTKVWNFSTWAWPGIGLIFLLGAAAIVTFGPGIARRIQKGRATSATMAALLLLGVMAAPAMAQEVPHDHDAMIDSEAGPAPIKDAPEKEPEYRNAIHLDVDPSDDLQLVLADIPAGSHVVLAPGIYRGSFKITHPMTLVGERATLDGEGASSVLTISADDVHIEGLAVRNSAPGPVGSPAGIAVRGDDISLSDASVNDSYLGISVEGADGVRIEDSTVTGRGGGGLGDTEHAVSGSRARGTRADMAEGRGDGISLVNSKNVLVAGSSVIKTRDGVYLSFAKNVMLDGNVIADGRYGLHSMYSENLTVASNRVSDNVAGMVMMYGGEMLVIDNHVVDNTSASTGFGLLVKDVATLEAAKNVIEGNRVGIHVEGPPGGTPEGQRFVLNTVALNGVGVAVFPSAIATFSGNSFVENYVQVVPFGGKTAPRVSWVEMGAGNYWSNYRGFDEDDDGLGDTTHRESGLTSRMLDENPGLYALLGSPALGLATSSHERWAPSGVGIEDPLPLIEPHSPQVPALQETSDKSGAALWISLVVFGLAMIALIGGARPRGSVLRGRKLVDEIA